jgi:hypothetical protein
MRSLENSLYDHELLTLRVIAEWWELDLSGTEKAEAVEQLARTLAAVDMQKEVNFLPPEEARAMQDLVAQGGRSPVAAFSREHGELRLMGPGRMEREEPWLDPVSATEALWYRGFLYRSFDESAEGVIEFYYMPDELLDQFEPSAAVSAVAQGPSILPLTQPPPVIPPDVSDAVDDLATLLAVAMSLSQGEEQGADIDHWLLNPDRDRRSLLLNLAGEVGWLRESDEGVRPTRAAVDWLKLGREQQLYELADAWSKSEWNDLCHTPGLICEGENWHNDPILARTAVLGALPRSGDWYRLADLLTEMKAKNPDFQRPDGNYGTWYIRDTRHADYLAGFESWDAVEGRLIRFLLQGPLSWLGMADVSPASGSGDLAFRLTPRGQRWLAGDYPADTDQRPPILVQPDAAIEVSHEADRYVRFQVARIAEVEETGVERPFRYRLTPASLARANEQGIKPERLLQFLQKAAAGALPKSVERALARWTDQGIEARLEPVMVLRVQDPAILETLRSNPKTRDYLGESLGELAVTVKAGMWPELRSATAQLGLFLDVG